MLNVTGRDVNPLRPKLSRQTNGPGASIRLEVRLTIASIARHRSLLSAKLNIGKMDLRIAAIALESAATVVTRNIRDFSRVPGLKVEDWSV